MASALFVGLERLLSLSFGLGTCLRCPRQLRPKAAGARARLVSLGLGCAHAHTQAPKRVHAPRAPPARARRESLATGCRPVTVVSVKIQFAAVCALSCALACGSSKR